MKIKGKELPFRPSRAVVVLPRSDGGDDIHFWVQAVLDYSEFFKQFPAPNPPYKKLPGQKDSTPDFTDPDYRKAIEEWSSLKGKWMILKSMEATEGLEWSQVKMNDQTTWGKIDEEFRSIGLSEYEVQRIYNEILSVNSLDGKQIEEARKRFFAQLQQERNALPTSPTVAQVNTPSGAPAKG